MTDVVLGATQRAFATGTRVQHVPAGGTAYDVDAAIWRRASVGIDVDTGLKITGGDPEVSFRLGDLESKPGEGDHFVVGTTWYAVVDPREDGEGGVKIFLQKTSTR